MARKAVLIAAAIAVLALLAGPYLLMYLSAPFRPDVWDYVERQGDAMVVEGPVVMEKAFSAISYSSEPDVTVPFSLDFTMFWTIEDLWWRNRDKPDWCERIKEEVEEDIILRYEAPQYFFEDDCRFIDEMFSETRSKPHWIGSLALISTAIREEASRKLREGSWILGVVFLDWREARGYAVDLAKRSEVEEIAAEIKKTIASGEVVLVVDPFYYTLDIHAMETLERNKIPVIFMYDTGLGDVPPIRWGPEPQIPEAVANYDWLIQQLGGTQRPIPDFMVFANGKPYYVSAGGWEEKVCPTYPGIQCGNKSLEEVLAELGYRFEEPTHK